ncbi:MULTISPECIES: amidohydrolase [Bacillaceae]|uniref:Amidohydrolase n=1 Tax=Evansella alkalicola TaxID=745819 RepID=A0ABS6JRE6_9BACI|nr:MULTISPECIES: amidohydrolase [Bacillaceae]MBU9721115.1 amidohydrolase [Bacillus alkalicola]
MGTLWYGGKVRTLVNEHDIQEAVFVESGIIIDVGSKELLTSKYSKVISNEVNLNGAVLYPGFVDSHLHMIGHGEKLLRLDLSDISSLVDLRETLIQHNRKLGQGEWLIGEGFNENLFNEMIPDKFFLDEILSEQPIVLTRVCRHALVTNSEGLRLAGIDESTLNPPGGVIVKEKGVPTGYLLDKAQDLVKGILPKIDRKYIKRALVTSLDDLYQHGFVGAHTEDLNYYRDPIGTLHTFYEVIDGESRKFRANLLVHHEVAEYIMQDQIEHDYVEKGSIKIFADGALGGRTALLSKPYTDAPSTNGLAIYSPEQLSQIVQKARKFNMPVAIHVIGDLALEYAIQAIEEHPVPSGKRDRLIHLQVTREDLIDRLKKLSVVLDIQPRFVASDFPWVEERLGEERLPYSFAWKRLLNAGLMCSGGSDAPIEPIDPILGIHAAVTRRKPENVGHPGYNSDEKLTLFEAIKLFTLGSAEAISNENKYGLIKAGYTADFTVLSEDLFELAPDEWLNVKVEKTVVDNTVMYERNKD